MAVENPSNTSTTATFNLTTIAIEHDGDEATNSKTFSVNYVWQGGPFTIAPLAPIVTIGQHLGKEDVDMPFNVTVTADPAGTSSSRQS